jgi:polyisoprenoid-binding protein YceI
MTTTATLAERATPTATTHWHIDPERSSVEFDVPHLWGLHAVHGCFHRFIGTLDLQERPTVALTVDARSVDTGIERRDEHLRSEAFLDAARHPQIRFASERVTADGGRLTVSGVLEIRGTVLPVDVTATVRRVGDDLEIEAAASIDQRALGITHNPLRMTGHPTRVVVRGRLVADEITRNA